MRVWVTRPEAQAEKTAQKLRYLGATPWVQPVMNIMPLKQAQHVQAIQRSMASLSHYHAVIFISQNAVNFAAPWIKKSWPMWPSHLRAFAIGSATEKAMVEALGLAHGEKTSFADNSCDFNENHAMNSEALLQLPWMQDVAQRKILIFRGQGGRNQLKESLESRGASVDYCELYCRVANPKAEEALRAMTTDERPCDTLLAYSGESAEYLAQAICNTGWNEVLACPLIVPGQRVAQVAQSVGFTSIHTADNASDDAMLACLSRVQPH